MKRITLLLIAVLACGQQPRPFRSTVSVVSLPVTFLDPADQFVNNIEQSHVTLFDNGAPQRIDTFEIAYRPISLVIIVETGKRMEGTLASVRTSGVLFTQLVLGESGEAAFITYDNEFHLQQGFTHDANRIEKQFKNLEVGEAGSVLNDAVSRALGMLSTRTPDRRKVIVIIGEGRAFGSETTMTRTLSEAQLDNVSIYTVELSAFKNLLHKPLPGPDHSEDNIAPGSKPSRPPVNGHPTGSYEGVSGFDIITPIFESAMAIRGLWVHPMKTYASGTGSNHINATSRNAIEAAVQRIGSELHSQYWVSYVPDNLKAQEFHKIEIKVDVPGIKVRNRPGYLYIPGEVPEANK